MRRHRYAALLIAVLLVPRAAFAHEGWGIVLDALGRLYVADIPSNTVWRIDRDGRHEAVVRDVHTHALVLGSDGAVYGTNVHLTEPIRGVWRLDMSGRLSHVVSPSRGLAINLQPFLIAGDGTIYSTSLFQVALPADKRELFLLRRHPDGVIDTVAGGKIGTMDGGSTDAQFHSIDGMAWLPDSSILLVDGPRLRRVDHAGLVRTLTPPLTNVAWEQDLMGASVGRDTSIYVADYSKRRILRVRGSERVVVATTGWLWAPTGVVEGADGLYSLEHLRAPLGLLGDLRIGPYFRVRRIGPDGHATTITRGWGDRSLAVGVVAGVLVMIGILLRAWRSR